SVAFVLLLAAAGIPLLGSQALLTPHHGMTTAAGEVIAITDTEVTLSKTTAGERVGTYGIHWDTAAGPQTGTATVGPVSATTDTSVTRPISGITGELSVGTKVVLDPNVWNTDPQTALGIPYTEVDIDGELGAMPAWQVDGDSTTWVLFV